MLDIIHKIKENLKENLKDFKHQKLNVIGEILPLIIFIMPIIATMFSIIKFYLENKVSMSITDKALSTYFNVPFCIVYCCLFVLALIIMFSIYFKNKNNKRKEKIKFAIILLCSFIFLIMTIILIMSKEKIINLNQDILNILTFNKGFNDEICGIYLLPFLLGTIIVIIKISKKEYKNEILLMLLSAVMSLIVFPIVVYLCTNIIFTVVCICILLYLIIVLISDWREHEKISKEMARENMRYMKK